MERNSLNLLNQLPVMVWIISTKFECTHVNKEWLDFIGLPLQEAIGKIRLEMIHPDDREEFIRVVNENRIAYTPFDVEIRFRRHDGEFRWILFRCKPAYDVNYQFNGYVGTLVDITQKMIITEQIREQEELFKAIYEHSPMGIVLSSSEGDIYDVNPVFESIINRKKEELITMSLDDITHPEDIHRDQTVFERFNNGEMSSLCVRRRFIKSDESVVWANLTASRIKLGSSFGYINICMIEDVTEKYLVKERIKYLNFHDPSTGHFNRAHFELEKRRLDNELRLPLSILILDVNGLSRINKEINTYKGDELLLTIAQKLRRTCRRDHVVCRTGGDEFSVLMPNTTKKEAQQIMRSLEEQFAEFNHSAWSYSTVSLGCATKTQIDQPFGDIINDAEKSMYLHKLLEDKSLRSTVFASMKATLLEKSKETREHAERVVQLSVALGRKIGLNTEELNKLELLANLHDIGKVGISDVILDKPGKLDEDEWDIMEKHTEIGYRIAMSSPDLESIAEYILHHHERYDGTGYPKGLKGEEIPVIDRIITIVDAYDAMIHERVYSRALSKEEAVQELNDNSGTQFDPELVKIFIGEVLKEEDVG